MIFKIAAESDIDEIAIFYALTQKDGFPSDDDSFADRFTDKCKEFYRDAFDTSSQLTYLARDERNMNRLVSFGTVSFLSYIPSLDNISGNVAFITGIFTDRDYKDSHLSGDVLKKLLDDCHRRGYQTVIAKADEEDSRLYRDFGFSDDEHVMVLKFNNNDL